MPNDTLRLDMRFEAPSAPQKEQDPTLQWLEQERSLLERAGRLGVEDPVLATALEGACVAMTERLRVLEKSSV